jgi:hypothetical protein
MSLSGNGMQQIRNLELYVLDAQGSIKREGEWPNKPGSQYQAWCNIFPHIKITKRYNNSLQIYVSLGTIKEPLTLFLLLLLGFNWSFEIITDNAPITIE